MSRREVRDQRRMFYAGAVVFRQAMFDASGADDMDGNPAETSPHVTALFRELDRFMDEVSREAGELPAGVLATEPDGIH